MHKLIRNLFCFAVLSYCTIQPFFEESTMLKGLAAASVGGITYFGFNSRYYYYGNDYIFFQLGASTLTAIAGWHLAKNNSWMEIKEAEELYTTYDSKFVDVLAQKITDVDDFFLEIETVFTKSPYPLAAAFSCLVKNRDTLNEIIDLAIRAKESILFSQETKERCDEFLSIAHEGVIKIDNSLMLIKKHPRFLVSYQALETANMHHENLRNRQLTNLILLAR